MIKWSKKDKYHKISTNTGKHTYIVCGCRIAEEIKYIATNKAGSKREALLVTTDKDKANRACENHYKLLGRSEKTR